MRPVEDFRGQDPRFWAVVKLVSMEIGFSVRKTKSKPSTIRVYTVDEVVEALEERGLDPSNHLDVCERVAAYSLARAELLEEQARPNLMDRAEAAELFEEIRQDVDPPEELLSWNKQKKEKRHYAYLACIVNMLTWKGLRARFNTDVEFEYNPRGPLTFEADGMPLRTLFRWMDGAYPGLNQPIAAWEVKEYYGTKTFGSRVADGVYETALDGYELNDLQSVGVDVEHYLFLDDRFTWWDCGKSYLCRIVDMLHADLLNGAFCGREVTRAWPTIVESWPQVEDTSPSEEKAVRNLF